MHLKILCKLSGRPVCKPARLRHKQNVILSERCEGERPPALLQIHDTNGILGRRRTALLSLLYPRQIRLGLAAQLTLILLYAFSVQPALYGIFDLP